MKILIVSTPVGISKALAELKVGAVYDVPPLIASQLVAERFAIFERRSDLNPQRIPIVDRRKTRPEVHQAQY